VSNDQIIVNNELERMWMKWMPNVGYYPRIYQDGLRKTIKKSLDLNYALLQYTSDALPLKPCGSAKFLVTPT
jgi:hypothetical protein